MFFIFVCNRFTIRAVDLESGINSTEYTIIDDRNNVVLVPATIATPIRRDAPNRKRVSLPLLRWISRDFSNAMDCQYMKSMSMGFSKWDYLFIVIALMTITKKANV